MRIRFLNTFLVIAALIISLVACEKDEDSPDPDKKDGQITFYTNSTDCGSIDIQLNGVDIGPLSSVYSGSSEPACGADNTLTVEVDIGAHDYHAEDDCDHIWEGTIIINKGDCKVKLLNRL